MAQTVVEKIAQAHAVDLPAGAELHAGDFVTLVPDHVMTHDNTAAVLLKFEKLGAGRVNDPRQPVFALDHNIQDTGKANLAKYAKIEKFAADQGVVFHPAGAGIGHQLMLENGFVKPGGFVVASDSHSNIYGALGAVGTPVVRTDAAALWATGRTWWQIPRTVRVELTGELRPGVTGKDVIITLCGLYNQGEALNAAIEFGGPGVASLSIESRMSISNMTTEWGALVGWFPCDGLTLAWLRARADRLIAAGLGHRVAEANLARWAENPPASDADAAYAGVIELDLGSVSPHLSGPDTVQKMTALTEMAATGVKIDKAYLVSCVNSRLEDLEQAAAVVRGAKVADGVEFYVAAASELVQQQAERSGAWGALLEAGARPLPPGCGPCIGLGVGLLEAGEVGISATNRNFKGRMGSRDAKCFLASPAVVAASALAGEVAAPGDCDASLPAYAFTARELPRAAASVEILDGFPARVEGRALWLPQDNLNTDGIYGKDYTYREDITPAEMAKVVMENYDPAFAGIVNEGDMLVGGYNFGTGSSREQAVTALQAAGVSMVVAASYSQTYLRNAINNGFICLESPALSDAVRAAHAGTDAKTVICDEPMKVDFAGSKITWRSEAYAFSPLGRPVQEVIVAGGVENQVREMIG